MYNTDLADLEALAKDLPRPTGYKVMVAVARVADKVGSIHLPEQYRALEDTASILGYVVAMGADTYADKDKFSQPYCKVGDWVMFRSYSGTRFRAAASGDEKGAEFRFVNDDQIEAVVPDPLIVERM